MGRRLWVLVGVAAGVAISLGHLPYVAGAASSLAQSAVGIVERGGHRLVAAATLSGASRRTVTGVAAVIGLLAPGVTALLLVGAARGVLVVRRVLAVVLGLLAVASFFALPTGDAVGTTGLALVVAGVALAATGPLLVAPLVAVATVIGAADLPRLLGSPRALARPIGELHQAIYGSAGAPVWLRVLALVVAAVPFAVAARLAATT
jgi:hypothetical protein